MSAFNETYNSLSVHFPASSTNAVAVGGTILNVNGAGNRSSEVAWSNRSQDHSSCDNNWGGGGGNSHFYKQPDWQSGGGVNNRYSHSRRQLPDLSAVATNLVAYTLRTNLSTKPSSTHRFEKI